MRVFHYPRLETNLKMEILVGYREKSCEVCTIFLLLFNRLSCVVKPRGRTNQGGINLHGESVLAITVSW